MRVNDEKCNSEIVGNFLKLALGITIDICEPEA